ncbi:hypothetical protein BASA60_004811 [Batrachochytrium salamandrivorans]|nr:hypothetical protein BASA60_004811 [Batrachochytrium salamandrivorans]
MGEVEFSKIAKDFFMTLAALGAEVYTNERDAAITISNIVNHIKTPIQNVETMNALFNVALNIRMQLVDRLRSRLEGHKTKNGANRVYLIWRFHCTPVTPVITPASTTANPVTPVWPSLAGSNKTMRNDRPFWESPKRSSKRVIPPVRARVHPDSVPEDWVTTYIDNEPRTFYYPMKQY